MMKKVNIGIIITLLLSMILTLPLKGFDGFAETKTSKSNREVVYFHHPTCDICRNVEPYVKKLKEQGITVHKYDFGVNTDLFHRYRIAYRVPKKDAHYPILYAGNRYFVDEDIIDAVKDGTIVKNANEPLKSIEGIDPKLFDISYIGVLGAGLIDGFNPCAIAMLLLFISLLTFMKDRRLLIIVCLSYISGIFISYLAFGSILFQFIHYLEREARILSSVISWVMLVFSLFFFFFNLYDAIVSVQKKYGKIKNQLPKRIQRFNKKMTAKVTSVLAQYQKEGTSVFPLVLWTFGLGFVLAFTEFMCTGQIYLPTIVAMVQLHGGLNLKSYFYLISYNVMFVLPLIIIAFFAIRTQSAVVASNKVRENLHFIKFFNALVFLGIFIYYVWRVI